MREPIVDIVELLVSRLTFKEEILEVSDNSDGTWTVSVCSIHHLRPCSVFFIEGTEYEVISTGPGETITFASAQAINIGESLIVPAPKYYHGTILDTLGQLSHEEAKEDMVPMIYLNEHITESVDRDPESSIGRTADIRLFFLDQSDFEEWDNDERYKYSVTPMYRLEQGFEEVMEKEGGIREDLIGSISITYHSKFGETINIGNKNLKFPYQVSGVEARFSLPIDKKGICGSCENCSC